MRILANENIPGTVIHMLRERGHDVLSAKESMRSQPDEDLLARAQSDGRLVISQDKDFGELAFRWGLPSACGIMLFRLSGVPPVTDIERIVAVIESRNDWAGQFVVVTDDRVRVRPLPAS